MKLDETILVMLALHSTRNLQTYIAGYSKIPKLNCKQAYRQD